MANLKLDYVLDQAKKSGQKVDSHTVSFTLGYVAGMAGSAAPAASSAAAATASGADDLSFSKYTVEKLPGGSFVTRSSNPDENGAYESAKHWSTSPSEDVHIPMSKTGVASNPPTTIYKQFQKAVDKIGHRSAFRVERGGDNNWVSTTWKEYYDQSVQFARALLSVGFQPFDAVNIIGFNSPEWMFSIMGAVAAGGMAAGVYATNEAKACQYIIKHSGGKVLVAENRKQMIKFTEQGGLNDTRVVALVMYDETEDLPAAPAGAAYKTYYFSEFMKRGDTVPISRVHALIAKQKPGHCGSLIYTSGTTGNPKAVMISHDNIVWTAKFSRTSCGNYGNGDDERVVSYLPLSHIAAQILDVFGPLDLASSGISCEVTFARPTALKGTLGITLQATRPTMFFGVPRVWEKFMAKIKAGSQAKAKAAIAGLIKGGMDPAAAQAAVMKGIASKTPTEKRAMIAPMVGLDKTKVMYTGAAPIQRDTLLFWLSIGLPVYEIYGMSECTGPASINFPDDNVVGSVGVGLPGTETMIDHVDGRDKEGEGEICMRGRHVMPGYMYNPDKSRDTIDSTGWLHSGDLGYLDDKGRLFITGRIKELIIGQGGENIAPVPIEKYLKKIIPCISNAIMIGDRRKYNIILVTLHVDPNADGTMSRNLTGPSLIEGSGCKTTEEAIESDVFRKLIADGLAQYNSGKGESVLVSRAQKVQYARILLDEFSNPGGELGPTLKLRRPQTQAKYKDLIDAVYAGSDKHIIAPTS